MVSDGMMVWVALFGLAFIGVLSLYFASKRVDKLTDRYTAMLNSQQELEVKQNTLLGVIGDRLENSTVGIRRHRELFEEQSSETLDWETIHGEMTRFRRDEHLLLDATRDLQDISQIRLKKLQLDVDFFSVNTMLKELSQQIEPHYLLKRNELVYRLDPNAINRVKGDARRIKQILSTFLLELGQELYESIVVLSIQSAEPKSGLIFDVLIPQGDTGLQMREDILLEWSESDDTHYSTRKLKNYIVHELIRLMGGHLTSIPNQTEEVHYRITLPLSVQGLTVVRRFSDSPLLVVSHNKPIAMSVMDMMKGGLRASRITQHILEDPEPSDLESYDTVIITYAALQEGWANRLESLQRIKPLRVIVLKNSFERNLPTPKALVVTQTLRLPLLPEKLAGVMSREPKTSAAHDRAAS